ncbi:MAG: DEAD/DEAH box helicase [Cyclobacteriaceae bacterium]|nr:DEAD/DEAH box helicase [Cyclobacteriaceae bacterium]MCH8515353.1 DEAD/DEAH box helicase [Cyclobacteriaceae bacterium]
MSIREFSSLGLSEKTTKVLGELGYENPTPIQAESIPHVLAKKDLIGQAQTGTGKTAAFAIPSIENIDDSIRGTQILVLCPTRELAVQVYNEYEKLAKYHTSTDCIAIYGGESIEKQFRGLKRNPAIVVGTPGRVKDHINRGTLKLNQLQTLILDEADEMLDMGFVEDIEFVLEQTPEQRQVVLFSATMAPEIMKLSKRYLNNPEVIKIASKNMTADTLDQYFIPCTSRNKVTATDRIIKGNDFNLVLLFCNTKAMVDDAAVRLQRLGHRAEGLHGDMSQAQRDRVMNNFRAGHTTILVATDVAARGLDVKGVDAVINYDIPQDLEYYVHRIGRTGRAGKKGASYTFANRNELYKINQLAKKTKAEIIQAELPSAESMINQRRELLGIEILKTAEFVNDEYLHMVEQMEEQGVTPEIFAAALLEKMLKKDEEIWRAEDKAMAEPVRSKGDRNDRSRGRDRDFGDRNRSDRSGGRRDRSERGRRGGSRFESNRDMSRLFINLGRDNNLQPRDIVGAIAGETGIGGNAIGEIDIHQNFSFVEIPKEEVNKVLKVMNTRMIKGNPVSFEIAKPAR